MESTSTRKCLEDAIDILLFKAEKKNMQIIIDDFPDGPCYVNSFYKGLLTVFQNILENAIKYGLPDTEIKISGHDSAFNLAFFTIKARSFQYKKGSGYLKNFTAGRFKTATRKEEAPGLDWPYAKKLFSLLAAAYGLRLLLKMTAR